LEPKLLLHSIVLLSFKISGEGGIYMKNAEWGVGVNSAKGQKVLIMEDETSVAEGLQMILEDEGYEVDLAFSGRSAMDTLRKKGVDLLVADLRLPDMDGMEVVREVKAKRPATKVIVITGYPSVSSAVDAMKLGVSDYLPKPFWGDDFKTAVENVFKEGQEGTLKQEPDRAEKKKALWDAEGEDFDSEDLGHPRILIMEDEPSLAEGLKMVLSEQGYRVSVADTGIRALGSLTGKNFDLMVADLRLPDMDGMEVLRLIKETKPETEVIVITGYASVVSAVESMKLGALDYLPKPFTEDEFKAVVEKAIKVKKEAAVPKEKIAPAVTEQDRLIQRREVSRVLDRTAQDRAFWRELMEMGSQALRGYHLSNEAKAAIVSGDLRWINQNVGELTQKQLMFIYKRLEREAW
jgi:DNA-binding NtrC family response regulator